MRKRLIAKVRLLNGYVWLPGFFRFCGRFDHFVITVTICAGPEKVYCR